jgi:hypothetical protein
MRPVLDTERDCADCSGALWIDATLVAVLAASVGLAVGSMIRLSMAHGMSPHIVARYGGTLTILMQHVQGIGLISSLGPSTRARCDRARERSSQVPLHDRGFRAQDETARVSPRQISRGLVS